MSIGIESKLAILILEMQYFIACQMLNCVVL